MQGPSRRRLSPVASSRRAALFLALVVLAVWPAHAVASTPKPPNVSAQAWILIDADDRTRLAAHDPDRSRAMASTTKLMTAYLALHELPLDRMIAAPPYHPIPGESLLGLEPGERLSVRDLLYGLLLPSGNDAAVTLADGVAGSTQAFVAQMNRAARRLGLDETSYANPIGLDAPSNYSSPRDLADLALTLRRNDLFRRIVNTGQITLQTGEHPRTIENHNTLLLSHAWVNGVKTGYTPDAGNVLVASGTRKGVTLLSVVMGTPSEAARDADSLALLDYGFSLYRREAAVRPGEKLGVAQVPNADDAKVALTARSGITTTVRRGQSVDVALHAPRSVDAPIRRGEKLGIATATLAGEPVGRVPVVAARGVRPSSGSVLAEIDDVLPGPRAVVWIIGVGLVAILILIGSALVTRPR